MRVTSRWRGFVAVAALSMASVVAASAQSEDDAARNAELNAYWEAVSATISSGDFEGYAATYHGDAVLVNGMSGTTYPIAQALAGWKQGFDDTRDGKVDASVAFRFSKRLGDETTAHETGIFHYTAKPPAGVTGGPEAAEYFVHFQALLVKKDGWKLVMEYQIAAATSEEWAALGDQ